MKLPQLVWYVALILPIPMLSVKINTGSQTSLHASSDKGPNTLRKWLSEDKCFNIAMAPQFNNQHSVFGILQFFKENGLLEHVSGVAACSGSTLPAVFMAAGKDFSAFKEAFPKDGWRGFGPSEPKITQDFYKFIEAAHLPDKLEDLKIPTAISLSMWGSELAMWDTNPNVTALVVNRGNLKDSMMAALATGSEGGIPDPDCPKCKTGFWPKKLGNATTITDGAFSDLMGVQGLIGLPKCDRLLHIMPLDYPDQIDAFPRSQIPGQPKDIVTLFFTQPPVASHGYFFEDWCNITVPFTKTPLLCNSFVSRISGGLFVPYKPTERTGGAWNQVMFEYLHEATANTIDAPFQGESEPGHKKVTLGTHKLFSSITTENEHAYNVMAESKRDRYWRNFLATLANQNTDSESGKKQVVEMPELLKDKKKGSPQAIAPSYEMPKIDMQTSLNYPAA